MFAYLEDIPWRSELENLVENYKKTIKSQHQTSVKINYNYFCYSFLIFILIALLNTHI